MAARKQPYPYAYAYALSLCFLLLALSALPCIISSSNASETQCVGPRDISVYWGQHSEAQEGSLREACDSRKYGYDIVMISYLLVNEAKPSINPLELSLNDHCGNANSSDPSPCSILAPQIKHCQGLGIKVFLSLRMELLLSPSLSQADDDLTPELAEYLVNNFLVGHPDGPLGAVSLDGINIENVADTRLVRWDELVTLIYEWSLMNRKVYISASPSCPFDQDPFLKPAIETGYLDYVWVEFYNRHPSCIYQDGNPDKLLEAWATWTSNVPESLIFLGLTADQDRDGYIEPEVVNSEILPQVKKASNYGGVMIWDRYSDIKNNITPQIKKSVPKICKCDCNGGGDAKAFTTFKSLLARS